MKHLFLTAVVSLVAILSACAQAPEAVGEAVQLETLDGRLQPILSDDVGLARAFEGLGGDVKLLEPKDFIELSPSFSGGLVSYTPIPDEIKPIPWWPIPLPEWWPPNCDPTHCDPREDFEIGWRFESVFATKSFIHKAEKIGLNPKSIASLDLGTVHDLVTDYGFDMGSVGLILPDDFDSPCFRPNPPRWCQVADLGRSGDPFDADIVILDSREVLELQDKLGELIQLRGEGLEPTIRSVTAVSVNTPKEEARRFGEFVSSSAVQAQLYEAAGVIPAHVAVRNKVLDKSMRGHVETAMKYGSKN